MTIAPPEDQSKPAQDPKEAKDPQKLVGEWNARVNKMKQDRVVFERQWHLNMAFFTGRQWVMWNAPENVPTAKLLEPSFNSRRVRLTINRVRLVARKELAKMNKERIRGFVAAASSDDADIAAARAGEKLGDYFQYKARVNRVLAYADFWMIIYGTSFVKHWYNPELEGPDGKIPLTDPFTGQIIMNPETGQPAETMVPLYGMPECEAISPFHIFVPNIEEQDIEKQEYVVHELHMSADRVFTRYGVKVEDTSLVAGSADERQQTAYGQKKAATRKGVAVREVWVKPTAEYPEGYRFVWAGEKVLSFDEGWPYAHKQFPFSRRCHIQTGRFYGESTITDLIPLQIEYNTGRSQLVENRDLTSRPTLAVPKGSIDTKRYTNKPGQIVEFRPGMAPPTPLPAPSPPSYVVQLLEVNKNEIDELSSQFENNVPKGVEAAAAISYLTESQDSVLQDTLRDKEETYQRLISQFLSYVIQFWDAERIIRVVGKNTNFEAFTLKSADLKGNTDYRVEVGSATPISRSAKQAQITELMKMGAIPVEKGLQYLELGDTAKLYEEMQIDTRQSERENLKMSKGVPVPINTFDDHMAHIREHDNYRKREEYENAPENVKLIMGHHVLEHLIKVTKMMGIQQFISPENLALTESQMQDPNFWSAQIEFVFRDFMMSMQAQQQQPQQGAM